MTRKSTGAYPPDWKEIAKQVKNEVDWRCVRCQHPHDPSMGYTLTVHHLDMNPANNLWWNTIPLCQRCHLSIQSRVILDRPWYLPHSTWFLPYVGGWYAKKYLGLDLTRDEVMANLDYYAGLEVAMLGEAV